MNAPVHFCTDKSCPSYGQRTGQSCGCHKTSEQMLLDQHRVMLHALERLWDLAEDHMSDHPILRMAIQDIAEHGMDVARGRAA